MWYKGNLKICEEGIANKNTNQDALNALYTVY